MYNSSAMLNIPDYVSLYIQMNRIEWKSKFEQEKPKWKEKRDSILFKMFVRKEAKNYKVQKIKIWISSFMHDKLTVISIHSYIYLHCQFDCFNTTSKGQTKIYPTERRNAVKKIKILCAYAHVWSVKKKSRTKTKK